MGATYPGLRGLSRTRAESRAEHTHPVDPAVSLGVIGLLLDGEPAVLVATTEAVGDAVTIDKAVGFDGDDLLELVVLFEPLTEHVLHDRMRVRGFPSASRRQPSKIDLRVQ